MSVGAFALTSPASAIRAVHLRADGLDLILPGPGYPDLTKHLEPGEAARRSGSDCVVSIPMAFPLRGGRTSISAGERNGLAPDPVLVAALRRAHAMLERDGTGRPTLTAAPSSVYERKLLRLAFLDPALQDDILAGRQPRGFRLEAFVNTTLPLSWDEQRRVLGWPARPGS